MSSLVKNMLRAAGEPVIREQALVFSGGGSLVIYEWISGTGFGAEYSTSNLAYTYGNERNGVKFAHNKDVIFRGTSGPSPYVTANPWNTNTGVGTAYSDPSSVLTVYSYGGVGVNSNDSAVVIGGQAGGGGQPEVAAYAFSSGSGFGSRYSNPSSLVGTTVRFIDFDPTDSNVVMGVSGSVGYSVLKYAWSNSSGFGSKTTYSGISFGTCYRIQFHPSGSYAVLGTNGSPYLRSYNYSSSGFGSLQSSASGVSSEVDGIDFNSNGTVVAATEFNSPYVHAYSYSSGSFGSKFSNPSSLPSQYRQSVAFTPDDDAIIVGGGGGIDVYNWSNSTGFGSKITSPSNTSFQCKNIAKIKDPYVP